MEIRIGKPARVCSDTERPFEHGEEVISLVKMENQTLVRLDFAKASFEPAMSRGALAVWATQYIDPTIADREPEEAYSPLRRLFYDAVESADRVQLAKAFLAAQLLRRQKVFRLVKDAEDAESDGRIALFTDRIGNRLIEVRDPSLTYSEMEAGRTALMEELNALEAPESADAEGAETKEVTVTEHGEPEQN